jgi:hypothetical protein
MSTTDNPTDSITAASIDAMHEIERACPSWCIGQHMQALSEGCVIEDSVAHRSADFESNLDGIRGYDERPLRAHGGGWTVRASHAPYVRALGARPSGMPTVELGVSEDHTGDFERLALTAGEARTLAAQLLRCADMLDLGR